MIVRHFRIPDEHLTRKLSARELGKQGMADQPQRWRRRLAINDWLLENTLVALVAVVCAAYAVVVTL